MGNYDGEFEDIWKYYPRKVARRKALGAYRQRRREGMTFAEAYWAVRAYASERSGEDEAYTMHCASFFGKTRRGWEDYAVERNHSHAHYKTNWL